MRTQPDKFKKWRGLRGQFSVFAPAFMALLLLAGCAQLSAREGSRLAPREQPLARMKLAPPGAAGRAAALVIAAEFALQNSNVTQAARDYAEAAQISNDPAIVKRALQLAIAARATHDTQVLLQRWQVLGASRHQLAGMRAQLAMLHGDRARAEREFGILLESGKVGDWKTFAADLLAARDKALAGRVLEDLATTERLPRDEHIWVALSQLGEHFGRHAFARNLATAAVRRFDGPDSIRWAARLKWSSGDHAGAMSLYAKGVAAHPRDTGLRLGYAALLGNLGKNADALRVLRRGPQTPASWAARVAFAARDRNDAALRRLYAELQRAPAAQRANNTFLLGQLAEQLKHDRQALTWYGQVDPDSRHAFDAQVRRAVLLDKTGQSTEAHVLATRLQRDYADDPESLRTACELGAQLYSRHGGHAQAIAVYDRGLATLPDDPVLIYDRGIEEANAGDIDAALKDFRKALAQNPDNVEAMNALGFTLADADRDLPEAARLLRKALAAKPGAAAIMDSWGWLQYRLGNLGQAQDYLKRAWSAQEDPDIGVHLGEVLWQLGQHQHAREIFAKVRKLDPRNPALLRAERRLRP